MAKPLITDTVWDSVHSRIPGPFRPTQRRKRGRRPLPDRAALTGIVFVLKSGIPWEELPVEMGCGSGMTCLRRLRRWQEVGAWNEIQSVLMTELPVRSPIDWSRAER